MKLNPYEFGIYERNESNKKNNRKYMFFWIRSLITIIPLLGITYGITLEYITKLYIRVIILVVLGVLLSMIYMNRARKYKSNITKNLWVLTLIPTLVLKYFSTITKFAIIFNGNITKPLGDIDKFLLNFKDQFVWNNLILNFNRYINEYRWTDKHIGALTFSGRSINLIIWIVEILIIYLSFYFTLKDSLSIPYYGDFFNKERRYLIPIDLIGKEDLTKEEESRKVISVLKAFQRGEYSFLDKYIPSHGTLLGNTNGMMEVRARALFNEKKKRERIPIDFIDVYTLLEREEVYIRIGKAMFNEKLSKDIGVKKEYLYFEDYIKVDKDILTHLAVVKQSKKRQ